MPGVTVTVGGDVTKFTTAMKTVETVALKSGSATASALKAAEAAILRATDGTKLHIQQTFLYEAALQKVRSELKLLEQAEIAAGRAAEERARKALVISMGGSNAIKDYYQRKAAQGGVNVYAPSGFGTHMQREQAATSGQAMSASEFTDITRFVPEAWTTAGKDSGNRFLKGFASAFSGSTSGLSQLTSVVSNTLSSLGSGMNPMRVFMQQAPNVAQAFTLLGKSARSFIAALGPVGAIVAVTSATIKGLFWAAAKVDETFNDFIARRLDHNRRTARENLERQREEDAAAKEKLDAEIKRIDNLRDADNALVKQMRENRYAMEKDDRKRHKMMMDDLKDELYLAQEKMKYLEVAASTLKATPEQRLAYTLQKTLIAGIEGRILAMNDSKPPSSVVGQPLTDRERIGAYAGGGNISLLDVSKKQYAEMVKFNAQMKELKATLENTY